MSERKSADLTAPEEPIDQVPRLRDSRVSGNMSAVEAGTAVKPAPKKESDHEGEAGKRNEEMNIILIIIGLLGATITAFIIYVQPQLQENSADTSAALLRVLLYNTNNTIFGNAPPPQLPDWPGAPAILTVAQIILYACLAATLLCGAYAMIIKFFTDSFALGWKNRFFDKVTRWSFFVIYLTLAGVFFWLFVALTLQVPFLPTTSILKFGAIGKALGKL